MVKAKCSKLVDNIKGKGRIIWLFNNNYVRTSGYMYSPICLRACAINKKC